MRSQFNTSALGEKDRVQIDRSMNLMKNPLLLGNLCQMFILLIDTLWNHVMDRLSQEFKSNLAIQKIGLIEVKRDFLLTLFPLAFFFLIPSSSCWTNPIKAFDYSSVIPIEKRRQNGKFYFLKSINFKKYFFSIIPMETVSFFKWKRNFFGWSMSWEKEMKPFQGRPKRKRDLWLLEEFR